MANRFLNNIKINDEYTLPATDGSADQVITTDGAGNLSFTDVNSVIDTATEEVYFTCKNSTGTTIAKGKGVMAVGTDGNSGHILMDEMVADGSVEPKYFLGILAESVGNGNTGKVIHFGEIDQLNTTGQNGEIWSNGQILWCDPDSAGEFTITEPEGPNVKIAAAFILNASTNGKIRVRVQGNGGIHELHDTKITTQADGELLVWNNTLGVWQNDGTATIDYTNGRVGIGTSSPSEKLDVNGNVKITETAATSDTDKFVVLDSGVLKYRTGSQIVSDLPTDSRYVAVAGDTMSGNLDVNADIQANTFSQAATGTPRNNLGSPTVTEMALFDSQFTCKTDLSNDYNDLTKLTFWVQETSSSSWVEQTETDDQKRRFLRTNNSSIDIPNGSYKFRVEFNAKSYTYANALYMYWTSQSHNTTVHIWKKRCSDGSWLQHTSSSTTVSSWPGHLWLPFSSIAWLENNTTSTGHYSDIRVEFTPNWSSHATYGTYPIRLLGGQIWGGYPSGRRTPHYYDQNGKLSTWGDFDVNGTAIIDGNVGIGTTSPTEKLSVIGKIALNDGGNSVFIGNGAGLNDDASDNRNVGIGNASLISNTTGYHNTANGYSSLIYNTTGYRNTANGAYSLRSNTVGTYNTANGYNSLFSNTTGYGNIANGAYSLYSNTTGYNNTANGYQALYSNTTGYYNTANGYQAGRYIADGSTANTTGNFNVFLGAGTKALADNDQNEIVIGYNATGLGSNTVTLGNDSITTTALKGNVGIGTTSPSSKLTVSGDVRLANNGKLYLWNDHNLNYLDYRTWNTSSSAGMTIRNSAADILLLPNGNVGIGTTSPTQKLHVAGTIATNNKLYFTDNTAQIQVGSTWNTGKLQFLNGQTTYLEFDVPNGRVKNNLGKYVTASSNIGKFGTMDNFATTFVVNDSEKVRIDTLGNVGIGTTSPNQKLQIQGGDVTIRLDQYGDTQSYGFGNPARQNDAAFIKYEGVGNFTGDLHLGVVTSSANIPASKVLTIYRSGDVGIGTTSPVTKLDVSGNITLRDKLLINGVDFDSASVESTSGRVIARVDTQDNIFDYGDQAMYIRSGDVGIGTTSPGAKLDVNGGAQFNTNTGATPFYITRLGSTDQALSIKVMDDNVRFESIQDETADSYGGFDFIMDGGTTEPNFVVRKNAGDPILHVDGGGNVGIGTTSPSSKLTVSGDVRLANSGKLYLWNDHNVNYLDYRTWTASSSAGMTIQNSAGDILLLPNGNVGIGITSPTEKLHVAGNGLFSGTVAASNLSGTNTGDLSSTKRVDLTSTVQTADYRRSVIALCEVTNTNASFNSYSSGTIVIHRANALNNNTEQTLICSFAKNYNSTVARYKMLKLGVAATNIRACTFTYNGVKYAGVELYLQAAHSSEIEFNGATNFNIFGLDYYDTQNNLPLNTEVNNSLNFTENIADDALYYNEKTIYHAGNFLAGTHYQTPKTTLSGYGITDIISSYNNNPTNANTVNANSIGYSSTGLLGQPDGALINSQYSSVWHHQIWGDFRSGQIATRAMNNGVWQPWRYLLDDSNFVAGTDYQTPQTTLSGYGITDAYTKTEIDAGLNIAYKNVDNNFTVGQTITGIGNTAGTNSLVLKNNTGNITFSFRDSGDFILAQPSKIVFANGQYIRDNGSAGLTISTVNSTADIHLKTNDVTRLTVDQDGKVGIGTTSPTEKLSVIGKIALNDGGNSVFIGDGAGLNDDASNNRNIGIGHQALSNNTTGYNNTANGYQSLFTNSTGAFNTATGVGALYRNTTSYNTSTGYQSMYNNTSGLFNTANGYRSLFSNSEGQNNVASGMESLYYNTSGSYNSTYGFSALSNNTTGHNNVAMGYQAGKYIAGGSTANNISNNSIFIGSNSRSSDNNKTNQIVIGYNATGLGSNTVTLGNDSITTTALKGNVGIGTTSPTSLLHLKDNFTSGVAVVFDRTENIAVDNLFYTGVSHAGSTTTDFMWLGTATTHLSLTGTGNVGIGTSAPSQKLQVAGTVLATGYRSADNSPGITQTITFVDNDSFILTLTFKNGLLTGYSKV